MITKIALFEHIDGRAELLALFDSGKVLKRSAPTMKMLEQKVPREVKEAFCEMALVKTRESEVMMGMWFERG